MEGFNIRKSKGVSFFSHSPEKFSWKFLVFFLLLIYMPFLGNRVVRPAGDDKVYVTQSLEMAERGAWFLQTYGGEPNYYKGPLHYILVRVGMHLFGTSMWATVYMNLILVILGALALGAIVQRNMREFPGWNFWVGMAFAVNAGIFSHMFASQMEVETASLFAIGLYFLDRSGPGKPDLKFWLICGLTGWLKSPLHAALLGSTAVLFWAWQGEILPRLKSPMAWLAAIAGILLCCVGYAPAYFFDRENFINAYVFRETLWKPSNGAPWHYPIIPLFTYSFLPWTLPAFVAFIDGISRLWRKNRLIQVTPGSKRVFALGLTLMIPCILFFLYHPYRGQNYNLPVIGGLALVVASLWATRAETWSRWYSLSLSITALIIIAVPFLITYVARRFDPMPFWWPSWQISALWLGAFLTARGFWKEGVTYNMLRPASLSRRVLWIFLAIGTLISTIGEREMIDIRDRIYTAKKDRETLNLNYYNLQHDIWSEAGYLNFMIPYKTGMIFNEKQLEEAIRRGDMILVPGDAWLEDMRAKVDKIFPKATWKIEPWRRWKTKGKNFQGVPAWKEAWDTKDLTKLEKNFHMVRVIPAS